MDFLEAQAAIVKAMKIAKGRSLAYYVHKKRRENGAPSTWAGIKVTEILVEVD